MDVFLGEGVEGGFDLVQGLVAVETGLDLAEHYTPVSRYSLSQEREGRVPLSRSMAHCSNWSRVISEVGGVV